MIFEIFSAAADSLWKLFYLEILIFKTVHLLFIRSIIIKKKGFLLLFLWGIHSFAIYSSLDFIILFVSLWLVAMEITSYGNDSNVIIVIIWF